MKSADLNLNFVLQRAGLDVRVSDNTSNLHERKVDIRAMTNSTPKLNNKVEQQQASPNVVGVDRHQRHCHRYHRSSKSSPFFHSGGRHARTNSGGRLSCSPQHSPSKSTRNSPLRGECSPRGSPTNNSFYAGAKFSEPPSPASLPKPPSHWVTRLMNGCHQSVQDISRHLTMVLQVQA